jgi:hypothetical protein
MCSTSSTSILICVNSETDIFIPYAVEIEIRELLALKREYIIIDSYARSTGWNEETPAG